MNNDGSYFKQILETMERYKLPNTEVLQTLSKEQIGGENKKEYKTQQLRDESETKSLPDKCAISVLCVGVTHSVWDSDKSNRLNVMEVSSRQEC